MKEEGGFQDQEFEYNFIVNFSIVLLLIAKESLSGAFTLSNQVTAWCFPDVSEMFPSNGRIIQAFMILS